MQLMRTRRNVISAAAWSIIRPCRGVPYAIGVVILGVLGAIAAVI